MIAVERLRPSFNTILEGGEWDFSTKNPSYDARYKLVNVPNFDGLERAADEGILIVNDGLEMFTMAGKGRLRGLPKKYIRLDSALKFWPGSAPPGQEENSFFESIRAVFTSEGLVFLNEKMMNYEPYIEWTLDFVEADAAGMFNCPCCEATYRAQVLGNKRYVAGYGKREKFDRAVRVLRERGKISFD